MLRLTRSHGTALLAGLAFLIFAADAAYSRPLRPLSPAGISAPIAAGVVHVAGLRDLGRAPATTPVQLAITLNYQHAAELDSLIASFETASSSMFGKSLTGAQFDAYFAPSQQEYQQTIDLLRRSGFSIVGTYPNRTVIDATAPASVVERVFGTELHQVAQQQEGLRYMNVRPATLPVTLQGHVSDVTGFNNLQLLRFHNRFGRRSSGMLANAIGLPLRGPDQGYSPLAFAQGYDLPVQHGFDGKGHTAGIVIGGDPSDSDLATFLTTFSIKRTGKTTRVPIDGGPGHDINDRIEATLDYETTAALAPGANIIIYEPNQIPFNQIVDSYNRAVSDKLVETLNSSFGICETLEPAFARQTEQIAKQALAIGIAFHASTGDNGSNGDQCGSTSVDAPASGPSFVAVGGTSLSVDLHGNYYAETTWESAGGGVSTLFPLPAYQTGVPNVITTGRNIPDISFDANSDQGESFFFGGRFQGPIGGTSLSTVIFGAMVVEINQIHGNKPKGFNAGAYAAFKLKGYSSGGTLFWHDITLGTNGAFNAQKGFDHVTGIGSPDAQNLAPLLP